MFSRLLPCPIARCFSRSFCLFLGLLLFAAPLRAAEFQDFGEVREVTFPQGFKVVNDTGVEIKSLPEARSAMARGFELREGRKWYVSDYSWGQKQKGAAPNYMISLEEVSGVKFDLKKIHQAGEPSPVLFPEGFVVLDLKGNVVKEEPGRQTVPVVARIDLRRLTDWKSNDVSLDRVFITDYSWQNFQQGKPAFVMRAAGSSRAVADMEDIVNPRLHRDWKAYRVALDMALEALDKGAKFEWFEFRNESRAGFYPWYESLADGSIPVAEAVPVMRLLNNQGVGLFPADYLVHENPEALQAALDAPNKDGESDRAWLDGEIKYLASGQNQGLIFSNKRLFGVGLGLLKAGKPDEAHRAFQSRWDYLRAQNIEEELSGNAGDNTLPNATGSYIYSLALRRRPVSDELIKEWIDRHLRRAVAQELGLSHDAGENNFDVEDFTTFAFQNLLAVLPDKRQVASIVLSAKGVRQQFKLATGAPRVGQHFDWLYAVPELLEVLARFGIKPWDDRQYALIDPGTLCLDYVRLHNANPFLPHPSSYLCLAYDRTGVRHLWKVEDLEGTEKRLREITAMAASGENAPGFEARYREACGWFLDAFVKPGLKEADPVRRLVICPDGLLNFIPFGGLLERDGRFLVDSYDIATVPCLRLLFEPSAATQSGAGKTALVLGNPAFDDQAGLARLRPLRSGTRYVSRDSLKFNPLPGTALELTSLEKSLRGAGWAPRILSGREATERGLAESSRGVHLLHLATHAYYLPDFTTGTLGLGDVKLGGDYTSGIALTGANASMSAWQKGLMPHPETDGILCPEELAKLDLQSCELVTLSACTTALGKVLDGEGVQGLSLGAATAGAKNLITTLWLVADEATAALMAEYYADYVKGTGSVEALNAVQRRCLARWRSQFGLATAVNFAAPFVCTSMQPFKAVPPLDPRSPAARLRIPRLRPGAAGFAVTVDRACKVWIPGHRADATWMWKQESGSESAEGEKPVDPEADVNATGSGELVMFVNGRALTSYKGTAQAGRLHGVVEVRHFDSQDEAGFSEATESYRELWQHGAPVRRLPK